MKKPIIPILILTTLFATALIANATLPPLSPPPVGGYDSGSNSILDPGCAPGTPNCWVNLPSGGSGWSLTGNSGTTAGTNFIGTTDAVDFVIKVSGNEMGRFYENTGTSQYSVALGGGVAPSAGMFVFGFGAGNGAINAYVSNFIGISAGENASDAAGSNFIGQEAGSGASGAIDSNFIGRQAGQDATDSTNSNFIGDHAGQDATDVVSSNFFGSVAGQNAVGASFSNFFGYEAGYAAINSANSNFFGQGAGKNASNSGNSNFIGRNAGLDATGVIESNFFGSAAGSSASNVGLSNFFGSNAGENSGNVFNSNFFGHQAGSISVPGTGASNANFFGSQAGIFADNASNSNFFGQESGSSATNATDANFFGRQSGVGAASAVGSNFFGYQAGYSGINATKSNFFGYAAGRAASNASNSTFIGTSAGAYNVSSSGLGTPNAANSIFIGTGAGYTLADNGLDTTTNPDDFAILIGNNTSTGGFENSIAIGKGATNTASNQFMIGSTTRPIDETKIIGSAGTECTITTGTGIACTSDERLKTNITEFTNSDILQKLQNIKTVSYNWKENPNSPLQIGFLAQNLEQQFPELVITDATGKKQVYYSQMTPILVAAVKELNLKLSTLELANGTTSTSIFDSLKDWLGNLENGITDIYAKVFHADRVETKELCVGQTCLNEQQIQHIIQSVGVSATSPSVTQNDTNHPSDSGNNSTNNDTTIPGSEGASSDQPITSDATSNPDPEVNPTNNSTE